jgi:arabinan endo-1,5-alpha-L-arabinosidase
MKKWIVVFSLLLMIMAKAISANLSADTVYLNLNDVNKLYASSTKNYPAVHDPSIVYNNNGSYYIFGSHNAIAKTTDLKNWSSVSNSSLFATQSSNGTITVTSYNNAFKTNMTKSVKVLKNGLKTDTTFGNFDAAAWSCAIPQNGTPWTVAGNMWAPDVIYNVAIKKWCMNLSLYGPKWNSTIILLTSDPYWWPLCLSRTSCLFRFPQYHRSEYFLEIDRSGAGDWCTDHVALKI